MAHVQWHAAWWHPEPFITETATWLELCLGALALSLAGTLAGSSGPSSPSGVEICSYVACRWHAAWQERCQALDRLRVCISRKRISFRLFKQWYWESFDDDVQVSLLAPAALLY